MQKAIFNLFEEEASIGQISQLVMQRHMGNFDFGLPTLGDVIMRCHPATTGHWVIYQRNRATIRQLDELPRGFAARNRKPQLLDVLFQITRKLSVALPELEQGSNRTSGL